MEQVQSVDPHETLINQEVSYDALDTYEGYDNPDIIGALRTRIQTESRGKSAYEKRVIKSKLISRYLREFDFSEYDNDEEAEEAYERMRADVLYWVSVPSEEWDGDVNEDGNYVGNGIYDDLARDIALELTQGNTDPVDAAGTEIIDVPDILMDASISVENARLSYAARLAKASQRLRKVEKDTELLLAESEWQESLTNFARAYTEKAMAEKPEDVTEEEWREIIKADLLQGMATEFRLLEQEKVARIEDTRMSKFVEWFNRGGKVRRIGKGMAIGLGVGVLTLPLGIVGGVVGAGGIAGAGALSLTRFAKGFAGWHGRKPSARELTTDDAMSYDERLNTYIVQDSEYTSFEPEELTRRAAIYAVDKEKSRTAETKKALKRSLAIGAVAVGAGAGVSIGVHFLEARLGVKDWVMDRISPDKKPTVERPSSHIKPVRPDSIDKAPNSNHITPVRPDRIDRPHVGAGGDVPATPSAPTEVIPPAVPAEVPPIGLPTAEQFANLDRLVNAQGKYPWSRAVDYFGGDQGAANEWIKSTAAKAGGTWHNEGTPSAWLEINGHSDTDYIWGKLVEASLQP